MRVKMPLCCLFALSLGLAEGADIKAAAQPAFTNFIPMNGVMPLALLIKNVGDDARGTVHIGCGGFQMDYPIELPHGAEKRLVTYPSVYYADVVSIDVATNKGNIHGTYQPVVPAEQGGETLLLVSDTQGDLTFLRSSSSNDQINRMSDAYVRPDEAPDRPVAYSSLAAVVLGPGSERLPDSAVRALHAYTLAGGTIMFLGGASAPVLSDPRWADIAPVRPGEPKAVSGSALIDALPGDPVGSFTITRSSALPQTSTRMEQGEIIVARRDVGFGKAVFFAFDPLDRPFTRWSGRRALFEKFVRPFDANRMRAYLAQFSAEQQSSTPYYSGPAAATTGGTPYAYTGSPPQTDPFSTELPPPTKVFWILAAYFIAVVPVNFLLLKKLKRGELAWVTAPIISVAFAGAFFAEAKDLYAAKLSRATQGLLIATEGMPNLFVGRSQLFFPQGGEFDLRISGVDTIGAASQGEEYYYYNRDRQENLMADLAAVDTGQVEVKHMSASNLAFREIGYRQTLPETSWVSVELAGQNLKVKNVSSTALKGASIIVAGKSFEIGELTPGKSKAFNLPARIVPDEQQPSAPNYQYQGVAPMGGLADWSNQTKSIVVRATVDISVGPQLGHVVQARQSVTLAYFTGLHYGKVIL